ncbi:MAG: DUF4139 domain-containing protein [Thermodesulfobacteriota bacterium]
MVKKTLIALAALIFLAAPVLAKVDLVTLPTRDKVQITIYNSADLTLVKESRTLTLKQGANKLQFSWAETLIDPTSLEMLPLAQADKIQVGELAYPPRAPNLGLWSISSEVGGQVPVEISYLTSGLTWRAFYLGTLAADEKTMRLEGYVVVTNNSGEEYENAQVRLIVGQVHLLDEIAELARREYPYGSPAELPLPPPMPEPVPMAMEMEDMARMAKAAMAMAPPPAPKEIKKEGLSEYFLYTIEGTETIPHQWSKRLPSFTATEVPVTNLYKYDEERYGPSVVRFLSFKNDEKHKLGQTPIPGGELKVFRLADQEGRLSYEGRSDFKYIPVDEDVELNLGSVANVKVEPKLMDYRTDNYLFDQNGDISGWDEILEYKIEVKNTRPVPVKVEITRDLGTTHWEIETKGQEAVFEKVDLDTVKYTLDLPAGSKTAFTYVLTTHQGTRAE